MRALAGRSHMNISMQLRVSRDYLGCDGVLGSHTRSGWRAFENGYPRWVDQPPYNSDMAESPLPTGASRIESILEAPR